MFADCMYVKTTSGDRDACRFELKCLKVILLQPLGEI